jgi:hypothetical protein
MHRFRLDGVKKARFFARLPLPLLPPTAISRSVRNHMRSRMTRLDYGSWLATFSRAASMAQIYYTGAGQFLGTPKFDSSVAFYSLIQSFAARRIHP